jgi:hypothetical protein
VRVFKTPHSWAEAFAAAAGAMSPNISMQTLLHDESAMRDGDDGPTSAAADADDADDDDADDDGDDDILG